MAEAANATTTTAPKPAATAPTSPPPARIRSPWRLLAPLLIVAAGAIAYCNSLHGPFIFDDLRGIRDNTSIRALWPPHRALISPPGTPFAARPITHLTFAISYALFGLDVRGYHVTNILLHVCTALVLYGLPRRTLRMPRL